MLNCGNRQRNAFRDFWVFTGVGKFWVLPTILCTN